MEKDLVLEINEKKNEYYDVFDKMDSVTFVNKLDEILRKERSLKNVTDYNLIETAYGKDHFEFDEAEAGMSNEAFDLAYEDNQYDAEKNLLGLYAAAEKKYEKRSFFDKLFHPIDTYREYQELKALKNVLHEEEISDSVIEDYKTSNALIEGDEEIPVDEAVKEQIEIDTEEIAEEKEAFVFENESSLGLNLAK